MELRKGIKIERKGLVSDMLKAEEKLFLGITKLLIYILACFLMFLLTDIVVFEVLSEMYSSIVIPFWVSGGSAALNSTDSNIAVAAYNQIHNGHIMFYIVGFLGSIIQAMIYESIIISIKEKLSLGKYVYIFFLAVPIVHCLILSYFAFYNIFDYETSFILVRMAIGGIIVGGIAHIPYRLNSNVRGGIVKHTYRYYGRQ